MYTQDQLLTVVREATSPENMYHAFIAKGREPTPYEAVIHYLMNGPVVCKMNALIFTEPPNLAVREEAELFT